MRSLRLASFLALGDSRRNVLQLSWVSVSCDADEDGSERIRAIHFSSSFGVEECRSVSRFQLVLILGSLSRAVPRVAVWTSLRSFVWDRVLGEN